MRDQEDDAESDGGETIGGADPQQGAENSANENARAIDDPGGMKKSCDQRAQRRSQSRTHETLPGDSLRLNGERTTIVEMGAQ